MINYAALLEAAQTAAAAQNPKNTVGTFPAASPAGTGANTGWYYVDRTKDPSINNTINQAESILRYGDLSGYIPGQEVNTNYWASSGNGGLGGKNALFGNDKNYKATAWTNYDYMAANKLVNDYNTRLAAEQAKQAEEQRKAELDAYFGPMFSTMDQQNAANQEAIRQRTQATVDSINSNKEGINDAYEKAARENYINSVLQKNQANDYMQAMGYNGGMTETNLAGINANYENNRANAILERDSALREIERLVAEAQASGNSDLAEAANNYYNNYISAMQNQAQMNYQIAQDQQAQANADRDYQLQLDQIAWNKQQYNDERADAANQAAEQSKQQIAANDFEAFLNTYQGKYNKQATYEKWIENLKKMDDPYGYNKAKIAYLTQYINSGMGKSTGSSGGSGGVRSSGSSVKNSSGSVNSRGGGNSTVTPNSATSYSYNTLKNNMTNALLKGASKEQLKNFVNPIEAAYNSGTITEAEARELLKMLGA